MFKHIFLLFLSANLVAINNDDSNNQSGVVKISNLSKYLNGSYDEGVSAELPKGFKAQINYTKHFLTIEPVERGRSISIELNRGDLSKKPEDIQTLQLLALSSIIKALSNSHPTVTINKHGIRFYQNGSILTTNSTALSTPVSIVYPIEARICDPNFRINILCESICAENGKLEIIEPVIHPPTSGGGLKFVNPLGPVYIG